MSKSKRRGPKKIGRTRKARSRRYGGAESGQAASPGEAAFATALGGGGGAAATVNGNETHTLLSKLVENMDIKSVHELILQDSFYKSISDLSNTIKEINDSDKAIKIVAILILVNYHIDNSVIDTLNTTFNHIVSKIKENKGKVLNDSINGLPTDVLTMTDRFAIMDPENVTKLKTYIEDVLRRLSGESQATIAEAPNGTPPG